METLVNDAETDTDTDTDVVDTRYIQQFEVGSVVRYKTTYGGGWHTGRYKLFIPGKKIGWTTSYVEVVEDRTGNVRTLFSDRVQVRVAGKWVSADPNQQKPPVGYQGAVTRVAATGGVRATGNLCRGCGAEIPPTGRRGRPAVKCEECRAKG